MLEYWISGGGGGVFFFLISLLFSIPFQYHGHKFFFFFVESFQSHQGVCLITFVHLSGHCVL